jgi:hypothetical protein
MQDTIPRRPDPSCRPGRVPAYRPEGPGVAHKRALIPTILGPPTCRPLTAEESAVGTFTFGEIEAIAACHDGRTAHPGSHPAHVWPHDGPSADPFDAWFVIVPDDQVDWADAAK